MRRRSICKNDVSSFQLEPTEEGPKKEKYRQLSQKMYRWIQSDQDCRQLKTAINLYAYIHRKKGEHRDEN